MASGSRIMSHHIWIGLQYSIKSEAPDYIYLSNWTTRTTNTQWLWSKPEAFLILCVLMQSASQPCLWLKCQGFGKLSNQAIGDIWTKLQQWYSLVTNCLNQLFRFPIRTLLLQALTCSYFTCKSHLIKAWAHSSAKRLAKVEYIGVGQCEYTFANSIPYLGYGIKTDSGFTPLWLPFSPYIKGARDSQLALSLGITSLLRIWRTFRMHLKLSPESSSKH